MSTPAGPPEGRTRATRTRAATPPDWRRDHTFTPPPRVPWSELGPQFALAFGRSDPADPQPEHIEVIGQNGSGKTHAVGKIYQERAFVQRRPSIIIATKPADATLAKIGFPVAETWDQIVKQVRDGNQNVIFWPRTPRMGHARRAWHDAKIAEVLDRLWVPASDTDIVVDDWGYAEKLPEVSGILEQYLREGRSSGLSVGALKQRPQGSTRLMTSETQWTIGFRPKDDADLERWAQLFGSRQDWMPVFRGLNQIRREFVIKHARTQLAYISWIDEPLKPIELPKKRRGLADLLRIRQR
jgi:hypothetical protein